ncbi:putative integral membrane protein [Streptomyces venezuelae ATCC 10712]|uniref:Putative integral membrane protein n=2 Tax=Streptomyces TaxID=1883 RepID=F2RHA6_STRVP|nr:putative integral membrane protein [Streptomyces venezuelae ATCC 10712]
MQEYEIPPPRLTPMAKWTPKHEAPEPLEGPVVATITGGTILWFVLFLVQVPFYGWFDDRDLTWWVWTCLAGAGLGLIGIWYVRKRDAAIKRHAAARAADATGGASRAGEAGEAGTGSPQGPGA